MLKTFSGTREEFDAVKNRLTKDELVAIANSRTDLAAAAKMSLTKRFNEPLDVAAYICEYTDDGPGNFD